MIASVRGRVARVGLDHVVVEVGGVGMLVHVTPETAASLRHGADAQLATSLVVREDSLTLYGFATDDERACFELVQTVSGVGPRLALAMLAVHSPERLRVAISGGDVAALTKVPGIGRKGAQKMVIELKDKVAALATTAPDAPAAVAPEGAEPWREQVASGLESLGWSAKDAGAAVEAVAPLRQDDPGLGIGELMRAALRSLAR